MSYHAEHLAWQQRVAQELNRASQFQRTADTFYSRSKSSKSDHSRSFQASRHSQQSPQPYSSYLTAIAANPKLRQYFDENAYKDTKLHEMYGFEASAKAVNAFREISKHKNPVLSRPSTAGSLKTRRSFRVAKSGPKDNVQGKLEKDTTKAPEKAEVGRKIRIPGARSSSRGSYHSKDGWVQDRINRLNLSALKAEPTLDAEPTEEKPKTPEDQSEPNASELGELEEQGDDVSDLQSIRPSTAGTWQTTSSQRRYISELERLLIEERKRREELEAKVDAILKK